MEERNIQVENLVILEKIGILKIPPRLQDIYKATEWSKDIFRLLNVYWRRRNLIIKIHIDSY